MLKINIRTKVANIDNPYILYNMRNCIIFGLAKHGIIFEFFDTQNYAAKSLTAIACIKIILEDKHMNAIKACIFDLDGVIVDTAKYHYLAWKRLADELGIEFTKRDNERLKGVSRMQSLDIILEIGHKDFDPETKLRLAEQKNKWYVEYIKNMDRSEILPGVLEFLEALKNSGMKTALGSASKNTSIIISSLGIARFFDAIIDGNKVTKAKPDPEVFLKAAEALSTMPDACLVFEDAISGVKAAKNAGMHCIGVGSPDILKDADKVISGFKNMTLDIVKDF
jgi:beta-phosphoglucomutase